MAQCAVGVLACLQQQGKQPAKPKSAKAQGKQPAKPKGKQPAKAANYTSMSKQERKAMLAELMAASQDDSSSEDE